MGGNIAIIGQGYVGLPLAREAARAGHTVLGLDISERVTTALNAGRSHVDDLSDADVAEMISLGYRASTDFTELKGVDTVVICVPTPLSKDGGPDLGPVLDAASRVGENLQPGMLVVLESTTYPGTTDEEVRPLLEVNGLVAGQDFHLAFSPERIDPGNATFGPKNTPKVVGGHTPACTEAAARFYGSFVDTVVRTKGTREAEMAKLLENTYRHINIALVNEMARFCHELEIDLWDVIDAAATKPFGFQAFRPGPGVGGHCIPIDPNYLSHNVQARLGYPFRFVELAQEINATMPAYVARRVQDLLNCDGLALNGAKVLLLGVTYKPNIADTRESPADPLAKVLLSRGADLRFHDPFVESWSPNKVSVPAAGELTQALAEADVCVLLQDHRAYDLSVLAASGTRILDTRGVLRPSESVERL
ncbi:nucleotide sugar dehydrogenase [Auraticoccus sp. F435]|uniref:Nucleotide sugar dehydrogenase n=1 Tax=Auraticoccus cholistanensis TaxID=2656650 RepID=A0A6A9V2A4_9ACTN|nr:nucleotide sugar dehydrogenase [Auraticoccus cholistanensis]